MNKSSNFRKEDDKKIAILFEKIIQEMDSGDVFGVGSLLQNGLENDDNYAPGDNRHPTLLGIQTRMGSIKKRRNKKSKKKRTS